MPVVAGRECDLAVVRCVCGRPLLELLEPRHGRGACGYVRVACQQCRNAVARWGLPERVPRSSVLVMHTIDLESGRVVRDEIGVFIHYAHDDRTDTRGGERLDASVLTDALCRRQQDHRR